jgi:molecular chaperone GrpE
MKKHKDDKTNMNGSSEEQGQQANQAHETTEQQQDQAHTSENENATSEKEVDEEADQVKDDGSEQQEEKDPLQQKQEEYQELYDKHLRLYSEFENFRRRSKKDISDAKEKGRSEVVLAILPVLDDFERAMGSMNESAETKEVYEGVELIYNKFKNTLQEQGLVEMEPQGQTFDPEYHEAMTKTQAPSEDQKGKVVDVVEKGYMLNDRIVRHAKVVVGE